QTGEVLGRDVEVAAANERIAPGGRLGAEVGDLRPELAVDALALLARGALRRALGDRLQHRAQGLGLARGVGAELGAGAGLRRRLARALRFLAGGAPLVALGEELDQPVDGWRRVRPGRAADESADVVELVVDQRFLERPGRYAGHALARPARVLLRLARQAADLGRHRERRLALDRLHQRLEWRFRGLGRQRWICPHRISAVHGPLRG